MSSTPVYLLSLREDGSPQVPGHEYIWLEPKAASPFPIIIRFSIQGTLSPFRPSSLWTNIPAEGLQFERETFREFKLASNFNELCEISVPIAEPGSYAFYTTYNEPTKGLLARNNTKSREERKHQRYYITVAPRLKIKGKPLPLAALSCVSVIGKLMGEYPTDWETHLRNISGRGYNMVHFTPLQVSGKSNSPFSIFDQLAWDPGCFPKGEDDVQNMLERLERGYSLLSITDLVLNHTADDSVWLQEHPEAGYNLSTALHLEAAYMLDTKLLEFSARLPELNLPTVLKCTDDLFKIITRVKTECIQEIRLWEFYVIDVTRDADMAVDNWANGRISIPDELVKRQGTTDRNLGSVPVVDQANLLMKMGLSGNDRMGERFRKRIDGTVAAGLLSTIFGTYKGDSADKTAARAKMVEILNTINKPFYDEYDEDVAMILEQIFNRVKQSRLDENGPNRGRPVCPDCPLVKTYFTRLPSNEKTAKFRKEQLVLVNHGWVPEGCGSALTDNAGPQSKVYLRREIFIWTDCVKLRYGDGPAHNPWLWDRMAKYTCMLAKNFAGFRVDNAHSTPIHVAEYMLDKARRIKPNLYTVAELFTHSEEMDYLFVKRLGLSSLVREAMKSGSPADMNRLIHKYGGCLDSTTDSLEGGQILDSKATSQMERQTTNGFGENHCPYDSTDIRRIEMKLIQSLFMDCTHDNEVPAQQRDARDTLPNTALVNVCACATGSVMGYDEIYPRLVDIVHEKRFYTSASLKEPDKNGIAGIKRLLNRIHVFMGENGYDKIHTRQEDPYVVVQRIHPPSKRGFLLIAHTAYPGHNNDSGKVFDPIQLVGTRVRQLGCWMLEVDSTEETLREVLQDEKYLRGLPSRVVSLRAMCADFSNNSTTITMQDRFPPGSIALFETWVPGTAHLGDPNRCVAFDNELTRTT